MKKIFISITLLLVVLLTGCGKQNQDDVIQDLTKKIDKNDGYQVKGTLKLINDEESYLYDVEVDYRKKDNFRVILINKNNSHKQIILKNNNEVYVLTPSLNKSFKFESDWPYNNSQIYILQSLINDINSDKYYEFKTLKNSYVIKTTVNYPNNSELSKQKIYLDKEKMFKKVEVYDNKNNKKMVMKFTKINFNANFDDDDFQLETNMKVFKSEEDVLQVTKIEDSVYPMYLPDNTYLAKEDKVIKENGERIIMTFSGDKPFILVQETAQIPEDYETVSLTGEPVSLDGLVAALSNNELTWYDKGIDYYIVSENLNTDELTKVAKSISVASLVEQK